MVDALVQRWDAFLEKTKTRAIDLMAEASGECARRIAEGECDPNAIFAGWTAVEHRTTDLARKVRDTWDEQVCAAMQRASMQGESLDRERAKGDALHDWIEIEIERTRLAVRCEFAKENLKRDEAESKSDYACTQCGAPLGVPLVFLTINVTCGHCRAINEYVPGTRRRMLAAHCLHDLPQLAAWPEYVVMRQAAGGARRTWEAAKLVYQRKFSCARVELLPDEVRTFEADLRREVEFYEGPIVVPSVVPLAGIEDLRARMTKMLEGALSLVSTRATSLTSSIFENARATLVHYGAVKTNVDQMACTVCGAPRTRDARDVRPCAYCGGQVV